MIPDFFFAVVMTCVHRCDAYNLQHDPTPTASVLALFASEGECNRSIPRYYSLLVESLQLVNADGTPAESAASAEKRAYADYRVTCSKVPADNLKELKK